MRYLSPEWFAAAKAAIENDEHLQQLAADLDLTIEQTVTEGPDDPDAEHEPGTGASGLSSRPGPVRWHIVLRHGSAQLVDGPAPHADLRFRASYPVARAIAQGELAAAVAFVRGDLTVGGNLTLLTTHQRTLAALHDVLDDLRHTTTSA